MSSSAYQSWISANVPAAYGACAEVTLAMQTAFPELTRVRGFYHCPVWGAREHWWLVTADGQIIDPTASQFPSRGGGRYEPWREGQREPTGMCPNCGGYCYDGDYCCSEECSRQYVAFCQGGR